MTPTARIDGERLQRSIEELSRIGATYDGGVQRIALTPEDVAAHKLLEVWVTELGCEVRRDELGNLFARRAGSDAGRGAVMVGSHLDSQPNGGRFDGALGVLAGVEVLRALHDADVRHAAPIELAVWTDEEGARYGVSCIGSSAFAGVLAPQAARALTDADGVTLGEAIDALGLAGAAPLGEPRPAAYLELHIEQGPTLDRDGLPVAVVDGIVGIEWLRVVIGGASGHAGTTPPSARRDALLAASRLVIAVDEIATDQGIEARGTVCVLRASPNAGSVITARAELLVDLRHPDSASLAAMVEVLRARCGALRSNGYDVLVEQQWAQPPISFAATCVEVLQRSARRCGAPARTMTSGAGHDAGPLAAIVPTAMLFVACRDGISHHPAEDARPDDVALATTILLDAVLELAR